MTRALKQWLARALIGVMLFSQFAIAAYACPAVAQAMDEVRQDKAVVANHTAMSLDKGTASVAVSAVQSAQACEQMSASMDDTSPNLCAEHCRQGQQSDQTGTLTVPAVLLTSLYVLAPLSHARPVSASAHSRLDLDAAVSPPHAILHCCWRD